MKILIVAGGTGGHIYPAIAIARELLDRDWGVKILFLTTKRGCGVDILKREEFEFKTIAGGGLKKKSVLEMAASILKLAVGSIQSLWKVALFSPDVAIGTGAYVTGPVLAAAKLLRIPCLIHEQNALPGATNKILGKIVDKIAVTFPETAHNFPRQRVEITGNPVRKEFFGIKTKLKEVEQSGLFTVLVFGGSQGAHAINEAMLDATPLLLRTGKAFRILHQTGEADHAWVEETYREMGADAEVRPFIFDMFDAFRLADIVVCRAGAMTLSELAAAEKAALLVPLPSAADNHQEVNARSLEKEKAAEVILEDEFLWKNLAEKIQYYMENPLALLVVGKEAKKFAKFDAASRIAMMVEELAGKK